MRRFTVLTAAAAAVLFAVPAGATTVAPHAAPARAAVAQRTAMDGSTVCVAKAGSRQCGAYQEALLRAVEIRATATRSTISVNDIGNRQLDALIASVN